MPVITAILTVEQRNALVMQAVISISAARRAAKDTEDSSSRAGCLAHIALLQSARAALDDGTRGSAWQQLKDAKARITELEYLLRGAVPHVRACAEHDEQAGRRNERDGLQGSAGECLKQAAMRRRAADLIEQALPVQPHQHVPRAGQVLQELADALRRWDTFMRVNYLPADCPDLWRPTEDALALLGAYERAPNA